MSFKEFEVLALDLSKKIKASNKEYDLIVGISRGGLSLAKILSHILDLPMGVISAKSIDERYVVDNYVSSIYEVEGNILLVDDVFEKTGLIVLNKIKKNYPKVKDIDLACVFYKTVSDFLPKYYIDKIKNELNIVFPYQKKALEQSFR